MTSLPSFLVVAFLSTHAARGTRPPRPRPDPAPAPAAEPSQASLPMPPPPRLDAPPPPQPRSPPPRRALRIAVLDVQTTGDIPARVVAAFQQSLTPELRKLNAVSAISAAEVRDLLGQERQRQVMGCSDEQASACMMELAGAIDADDVVTIQLSLVGNAYTVSSRRLDSRAASVVQSDLRRLEKRDGEELLATVGPVVAALYPERELKPGAVRGVPREVAAALNPPPLPRWAFFTTAGVGAVALGGGLAFGLSSQDAQRQWLGAAQLSVAQPVPATQLRALQQASQQRAQTANLLFMVGGGLCVAAGVEALFVDWRDLRGQLSVTPSAGPGFTGVLVGGDL